jgi:hypothetical protein
MKGGEIFMLFTKNNLRSIPSFRKFLDSLEAKYTEDKLNDLVSRQNQSPGSSIYWTNLNYLTIDEVLFLFFLGIASKNKVIRVEILEKLLSSEKYITEASIGGAIQKALLLRMIQDHLKRGLPLYTSRWNVFWRYFPQRKILGLLTDPQLQKSISKRLRPKLWSLKKVRSGGRIRGYRDHGTCRPSHKWLPRYDFSMTRNQLAKENLDQINLRFYEVFLTQPFWLCFSKPSR